MTDPDSCDIVVDVYGTVMMQYAEDGDLVDVEDAVFGVESMKMEIAYTAPIKGRVQLLVKLGAMVEAGQVLARVFKE